MRGLRRLKRLLNAFSPGLHDRLLAWYRGRGRLRRRVEAREDVVRIDRLAALVEEGRQRGVFEPAVADRLTAWVEDLRREVGGA